MMASRLKPIRLSPKAIDAPETLTVTILEYELFKGSTRDGDSYEEDRVYFIHSDTPMFTRLNNLSIMKLAHSGIDCTEKGLTQGLVGLKVKFELQKNGKLPFYLLKRVYK